ncbi:MAG: sigma 54-interacting transcriptional regulator [Pseudomonadota bacterium]
MSDKTKDHPLMLKTLEEALHSSEDGSAFGATVLSLGVVWHLDYSRIGATAPLRFDREGKMELSRLTPEFHNRDSAESSPLFDQHLSRTPLIIKRVSSRKFSFTLPAKRLKISINGRALTESQTVDMDELGDEIIITLSNAVILSIFNAPARPSPIPAKDDLGLIGVSNGIELTRHAINRVASSDIPVLIRGETGTGKELIARAIHRVSERSSKEMISINMAAFSPSLAAAELFGVKKGAFTGAAQDKLGLFERAHGGTLFLDEIGDTPSEVQPMLLRALEFGEVRRIGGDKSRNVDVRIIAATDRSLERVEGEPSFNQPLLQRLQGFSIEAPPLRHRRVDIGVLFTHLWSLAGGEDQNVDGSENLAAQFTHLATYAWPGNVRELRNVVQQIVLGRLPTDLVRQVKPSLQMNQEAGNHNLEVDQCDARKYKNPADISDAELINALNETGWVIKDAAVRLNVSRTSLYELMSNSSSVRDIDDISDEELQDVLSDVPGGIDEWVRKLRVGRNALRRRLKHFGRRSSD